MFLALEHGLGIYAHQLAAHRLIAGDSLASQIQRECVVRRVADHAGQNRSRLPHLKIRRILAVAGIHHEGGSGGQEIVADLRMTGERGGSADDNRVADKSLLLNFSAHLLDGAVHAVHSLLAVLHVHLVIVAVVAVKASHLKVRIFGAGLIKLRHLPKRNSGAVLSHVHIQKDGDDKPGSLRRVGQLFKALQIVSQRPELGLGTVLGQVHEPLDVGPHQRVGH